MLKKSGRNKKTKFFSCPLCGYWGIHKTDLTEWDCAKCGGVMLPIDNKIITFLLRIF
jgi:ribosomal protein L37AE/L43A